MFDRDLTHWYRELFFTVPGARVTGSQPCEAGEFVTAQRLDGRDAQGTHWLVGRRLRGRHRWERTDAS
jgi:hypothetical protein